MKSPLIQHTNKSLSSYTSESGCTLRDWYTSHPFDVAVFHGPQRLSITLLEFLVFPCKISAFARDSVSRNNFPASIVREPLLDVLMDVESCSMKMYLEYLEHISGLLGKCLEKNALLHNMRNGLMCKEMIKNTNTNYCCKLYMAESIVTGKARYDSIEALRLKCGLLADWIQAARHVVVHTGAGISTAAGIPDFRGTNGVWTLEQKGLKPTMNISFDEAIPTKTHMALKKLVDAKKVKFIISQNIDGLHLRSGVQRQYLAELHGNMFTEQCDKCGRQFIRNFATKSVGKKSLDTVCRSEQIGGRPCRGRMHDTILDWEHNLPDSDLTLSDLHSSVADLSICLGTTLQIIPSGNLPLYTKKYGGRLVICNLQPTKHDKKADLIINGNVDEIMISVMKKLGLEIPEYESTMDPTRNSDTTSKEMDWTIPTSRVKEMNVLYKKVCKPMKRKRKTFMYERERTDTKRETKTKKQAFMMKQDIKTEDAMQTANQVCNNAVVPEDISSNAVKIEDEMKDVEPFEFTTTNMTQPDLGLEVNDIL